MEISTARKITPSIITELFFSNINGRASPPNPEPICKIFRISSEFNVSLFSSLFSKRKNIIKPIKTSIILVISILYHLFNYKISIKKRFVLFMKFFIKFFHPLKIFPNVIFPVFYIFLHFVFFII